MSKKISVSSIKISVSAKNSEQKEMLRTISQNDVTFVKGAPGSGKTHLAVSYGLQALFRENYEQLIFTRPVVEAGGEKLGFLPGNMYETSHKKRLCVIRSFGKLRTAIWPATQKRRTIGEKLV